MINSFAIFCFIFQRPNLLKIFAQTGQLLGLSQQELMDCSWGEGNNACDGGEDFRAYQWILKHGLATSDDYGPYQAIVRALSNSSLF